MMAALPSTSPPRPRADGYAFRHGAPEDAPVLLRLIEANLDAGHLLPRTLDDLTAHASRFVVIEKDGRVVRLTLTDKGKEVLKELGLTSAWRDALQDGARAGLGEGQNRERKKLN